MMLKASPIAIDYQALERCFPSWERFCQRWQQLDRVEMTGEQCQALLGKVMDSTYFSSEMLVNPSIAEFAAVIRNPELKEMDTHTERLIIRGANGLIYSPLCILRRFGLAGLDFLIVVFSAPSVSSSTGMSTSV